MVGEKNPLPQLRRPRDHAIFGILFVMESGMPKTLLLFDHDKEPYNICVSFVWNKFRSNTNNLFYKLLLKLELKSISHTHIYMLQNILFYYFIKFSVNIIS